MTPSRTLMQWKTPLNTSGSIAALLVGSAGLFSSSALADPSITHTGDVTPFPSASVMNWQWSGELFLGKKNNAEGTLEIRDGASASGSLIHLGYGDNSMGSVRVDGKGSSLTTNTDFFIGDGYNDSKGALTISNGGRVDVNGRMVIGNNNGSTGDVIVTGEESSLNSGSVAVGNSGVGHLTVADGGQVNTQYLYVGALSGRGSVTITGQGSAWNGKNIYVGGTPSGAINLSDGGSINGSSLQIAGNAFTGGTGTVNVGGRVGEAAQASGNLNVDRIVFDNSQKQTNGSLSFNTTNGTTIRAAISGEGAIDQIAGTTVLTGDNSAFIGGGAYITGGTLQLGDGGTSGNLAVDVSTGTDATHKGVLAFNRSDDVTFSNVISGTGSVAQMGTGTTTLTEDNTYSGGTAISGGALSVSSDAKLGSADGGLTLDDGTLQVTGTQYTSTDRTMTLGSHGGGFDVVDASNSFSVTQALSGDGRVWKRGDGTLTLYGDNSFSGGLTVEKGTVQAGGSVTLSVQVS